MVTYIPSSFMRSLIVAIGDLASLDLSKINLVLAVSSGRTRVIAVQLPYM
jgi:hypothetical protein